MEHPQLDAVRGGQLVKQLDQCNLSAVQLPVAGENTAVLVAVRVAQHDVLFATTALDLLRHARQGVELAHDGCGVAQVFDGFKKGHDNQIMAGRFIQCSVH